MAYRVSWMKADAPESSQNDHEASSTVTTSLGPAALAVDPSRLSPDPAVSQSAPSSILHVAKNTAKTFSPLAAAAGEMFPPLKVAVAGILGILTIVEVCRLFSYIMQCSPL